MNGRWRTLCFFLFFLAVTTVCSCSGKLGDGSDIYDNGNSGEGNDSNDGGISGDGGLPGDDTLPPGFDEDGDCTDEDQDGDGTLDCEDSCPWNPEKIEPGDCGCGMPDLDENSNGISDCLEEFSWDEDELCSDGTEPGECGCGMPDEDMDGDGIVDCEEPGFCAQGVQCIQDVTSSALEVLCSIAGPMIPTLTCMLNAAMSEDTEGLLVCSFMSLAELPGMFLEGSAIENIGALITGILPCAMTHFNCVKDFVGGLFGGDFSVISDLVEIGGEIPSQAMALLAYLFSCADLGLLDG